MTSEKQEQFLLHNFEAEAGTPVWAGQPKPEPKPVAPAEEFLLHDFEAEAETPVWGNKPVEDEAAMRKRLYKPLKREIAAAKKKVVRGPKKPESIVLPKLDEEEDKSGVAPQTATRQQKATKEKQD